MFKKILATLGKDQPREVTQVINIYDAVTAHRAWKKRLIDYLEGNSTEDLQPATICKDHLCVLGKWIYSDGKVRFGQEPTFIKLVDEHASFHVQAAKVVEAHQQGNTALAQQVLAGDFEEQSKKTVTCLARLNTIVEAHNQRNGA